MPSFMAETPEQVAEERCEVLQPSLTFSRRLTLTLLPSCAGASSTSRLRGPRLSSSVLAHLSVSILPADVFATHSTSRTTRSRPALTASQRSAR